MVVKEIFIKDPIELKARILQNLNRLAQLHAQIKGLSFLDDMAELVTQLVAYKRSTQDRQSRELKIWELVEKANKELKEQQFISFGQETETTIFNLEYEVHKLQKLTGRSDPSLNIQIDRYNTVVGYFEKIRKELHNLQATISALRGYIKAQAWRTIITAEAYDTLIASARNSIMSNLQEIQKMYIFIEALQKREPVAV